MNLSMRLLFAFLVTLFAGFTATTDAAAQGTCSCNSGCHARPGQCVQPGSNGCMAGFAPFCGTRTASCPQMGWVSCSGTCQCVPIPGYDAGVTVDASPDRVTPPDVQPDIVQDVQPEASFPPDVQPPPDAPAPPDVPSPPDVVSMPDEGAPDASMPPDVVVLPDGMTVPPDVVTPDVVVPPDTPGMPDVVSPPDSMPDVQSPPDVETPDAMLTCPMGVIIAGRCITDRCAWNGEEIGWVCSASGHECRLIEGVPYCVPMCLGTTCPSGQVCVMGSGCVMDRCATIMCPAGSMCVANQCVGMDGGVVTGDGGSVTLPDGAVVTVAPDGAVIPPANQDASVRDGATNMDGGSVTGDGGMTGNDRGACGCRTTGSPQSPKGLVLFGLLAVLALRRRRRS